MDRQYPNHHHHLFNNSQSSQLPPLHLPPPHSSQSFRQANTLPPIEPARYPPANNYHPSLSSPGSSHLPWPGHRRTSDSKPQILNPTNEPPPRSRPPPDPPASSSAKEVDDGMPPTSDFVKKLYKMLQDNVYGDIVSWGPQGDCFIIKDMTEFTKSILPRMFKHSNFASFVRQLNKYDFHKVKNNEENTYGDHSWTFRHPDFQADRRDALENIKRKVPAQRKGSAAKGASNIPASPASAPSPGDSSGPAQALQSQIDRLTRTVDDMSQHIRSLERNYQNVLTEMVNFQRNMAQQDGLMQNLIQYFLQIENGKTQQEQSAPPKDSASGSPPSTSGPTLPPTENQFVPVSEAARIMGGSFPEQTIARATFEQMNEISRRANSVGMQFAGPGTPPMASGSPAAHHASAPAPLSRADALQRIEEELHRARPSSTPPASSNSTANTEQNAMAGPSVFNANSFASALQAGAGGGPSGDDAPFPGLQVFTVGHLLPRSTNDPEDSNGTWSFDPSSLQQMPASSSYAVAPKPRAPTPQRLRVRRSTFVPGWAVPPRVLLVDDDAVSRKLSSKFLQVFGCTIDVAVDGVGAVNKMNLEKYDLVLMDIVMPKLDGVSATSLIRQFDPMTPIISMTSNSKPNEIMTYYSSGMNDILPKPFTKEGLLDMLEKHLMHLKVIQEMAKVPRSLNDTSYDAMVEPSSSNPDAAAAASSSSSSILAPGSPIPLPPMSSDDARINPLAGLGLSDEQYVSILQNMVGNSDMFGGGPAARIVDVQDVELDMDMEGEGEEEEVVGVSSNVLGKRRMEGEGEGKGKKRRFQVVEQ
ncbi:hypothetical protein M422DRAFT_252354 [Sphaerobolus stellatus SS14]|uniref:Response regulatory domain-containing protein n=1 Tax=Sphaerobolus stellatus (strain SS14) TaxID=990650 RepID=A0A0C9VQ27_SPHS4|nr:hypothetical protein M422DRAFT_252354 [Sphaerobolus stellatus SS14]